MIAVIQRVSEASVSVQGCKIAEIGPGLMILLGVKAGDTERHAEALEIFHGSGGREAVYGAVEEL